MNAPNGQKPQPLSNAQRAWLAMQNGQVVIRWRKEGEPSTIARVLSIEGDIVILQIVATGLVQIANFREVWTITQSIIGIAQEVPHMGLVQ